MRTSGVPIIVVTAALLLSAATRVDACSCIPTGPPCQSTWDAGAVFVARVLRVDDGPARTTMSTADPRRVSVDVLEVFRGFEDQASKLPHAPIDIFTSRGGASCGFPFVEGETYVIYGDTPRGDRASIHVSSCSRTRAISNAAEDLAYLRTLRRADTSRSEGVPDGGRIFGRVEIQDPIVNPSRVARPAPEPLRDVPITLTADVPDAAGAPIVSGETKTAARRWQTRTNEAGAYAFEGLPPGTYRVQPDLPPGLSTYDMPRRALLRDVRGCHEVIIGVQHDGRVSGRLLDADGRPVAGQTVALMAPPEPGRAYRGRWLPPLSSLSAQSGVDGTFEVTRVPPGVFAVVSDAGRTWSVPALPYPQVLYPGVTEPTDAKVVQVGPSAHVRLEDWRLPATFGYVYLTGEVMTAEATPAAGADVRLVLFAETLSLAAESRARPLTADVVNQRTDASGRFRFAVLPGRRYALTASWRAGAASAIATSGPFVAEAEPPPVSLRLSTAGH